MKAQNSNNKKQLQNAREVISSDFRNQVKAPTKKPGHHKSDSKFNMRNKNGLIEFKNQNEAQLEGFNYINEAVMNTDHTPVKASPREVNPFHRGKSASNMGHNDMPPELQAHLENMMMRSSISQNQQMNG